MAEEKKRRVSVSIQVEASAERALAAFLEVEQIKQWWGAARGLVEPRRGGVWPAAWGEPGQSYRFAVSGVVKSLKPAARLRLDPVVYFNHERGIFGPMRLTLMVKERDGRTRVRATQEGGGDGPEWEWFYETLKPGWKESLANLKRFLEK